MMKKCFLFLIICISFISTVEAIGVGVSPANLTFDAHVGIGNEQTLFVKNDGSGTSNYRVYVDDEYINWFDISPNNFSLVSGEHKEVTIAVKPPITANGEYDMKTYVIATSSTSDFEVGSGIKIPVHIEVSNKGLFAGLAILLLFGFTITVRSKRNKPGVLDHTEREQF
ncbi:hypothetical protein V7O62_00895 [Methanolobus sp. ZRKC2]|uniref:COG1470 family protein n=1 Tax=Methanolobus sp. ZRKC2 TaxID=3125783 RepID=UPI00324C9768